MIIICRRSPAGPRLICVVSVDSVSVLFKCIVVFVVKERVVLLNEKLLLPSDAPEPEPASPPAASDAPEPEPASPSVATLFYYPTTTANEEPDEHDIPSLAELAVKTETEKSAFYY